MADKVKKTFVMYADMYPPTEGLSAAQKGQLWDAVFRYHSGKEVLVDDPMAAMAFSFFKQIFERDAEKYEDVREKRRAAGRQGGNARSSKQSVANEANATFAKQSVANEADNVNVNDNVNTPPSPPKGGEREVTSFVPPTLEEVEAYVNAGNRNVDPFEFWTKYNELGWIVNGAPMKSWKLTVCTWHRNAMAKQATIVDPLASRWSTPPEPPVVKAKREEIESEYVPLMKKLRDEGNWKRASEIERIMDKALEDAGVAPWLR